MLYVIIVMREAECLGLLQHQTTHAAHRAGESGHADMEED